MGLLPTEKTKVVTQDPKNLILFGLPKVNLNKNLLNELLLEKTVLELFLKKKQNITTITYNLMLKDTKIVSNILKSNGYIVKGGMPVDRIIANKLAVDYYIQNINNHPNLSLICRDFNVERHTISKHIKNLGYNVIDYLHTPRFDEHIFDCIDTEEKAYWLGFIYADGYIASNPTNARNKFRFELSLQSSDYEHLCKFNNFVGHILQNIKLGDVKLKNKCYNRCRWVITNEHFYKTLNSLGCVPNKSLVLKFPDLSIFQSKDLIRHFIRGYFDGDGCISWSDKNHKNIAISVLGTLNFLEGLMINTPPNRLYRTTNNSKKSNITKVFSKNKKSAFLFIKYLYSNATVYLDRKYQKFLNACRLYEKS